MEEIPVQLQVEFKDKDGRKRLRVINDRVKISRDENEFKAKYDQKLNAMMNIQAAGTEYYAGKADASKERLQTLKENIMKEMTGLKKTMKGKFEEKAFSEGADFLADELKEIDTDEKQLQNAPAQSFMAAKGQSRARMSQEEKKMKMEKKK
jgi:hypothetical protein